MFWMSSGGRVAGPYGQGVLQQLWSQGRVAEDAQLCPEGTEDWSPACHYLDTGAPEDEAGPAEPPEAVATPPPMPARTVIPGTYLVGSPDGQAGPFKRQQIRSMWKAGQIVASAHLTEDGKANWAPVQQCLAKWEYDDNAPIRWRNAIIGCCFAGLAALFVIASNANQNSPKGPKVYNSEWDGSVRQVKRWMDTHLADPEAEGIRWSPVVKYGNDFIVEVDIRGRNALGGWIVETYRFKLDAEGRVLTGSPLGG